MSLHRFDDVDAFAAAATPLVAGDDARSVGLRVWIAGAKQARDPERRFMATWLHGGVSGVGYQRGEYPLVIGDSAPAACAAFADALAPEWPQLAGVVGSEIACAAFARRWQARTGRRHAPRFHMRNHVLDRLVTLTAVPGSARIASDDDRDWLLAMHQAFAEEAHVAWTPQNARRLVDERLAAASFRIWSDGVDVAFAGFTPAASDAARIAPVYTLPAFRRRGYGAALVGAICADLLASGRRVFLVTDVTNPTSNRLYARLGFRPLDDFREFDFVSAG